MIAQVGTLRVNLPSGKHESVTVHVGPQHVSITSATGAPMESEDLDVRAGRGVLVVNVLGAGLVYRERVVYHPHGEKSAEGGDPNPGDEPEVACGKSIVEFGDADHVFTPPPKTISTSQSAGQVTRMYVDFIAEGWSACTNYLARRDPAGAAELTRRVAAATGYPYEASAAAVALTQQASGSAASIAFLTPALAASPDAVELHRLYQVAAMSQGKRQELIAKYQKMRDEKPDNPDRGYLLARLLAPAAAAPVLDDSYGASRTTFNRAVPTLSTSTSSVISRRRWHRTRC